MRRFAYLVWCLCVTAVVTVLNYGDSGSARSWGSPARGYTGSSGWHK